MKLSFLILLMCFFSSCDVGVSSEELKFVESNAWVRSDPDGFTTARFHFDNVTGPSFELRNDTLYLYNGEFMGIISFVDTINGVVNLRSLNGSEISNYKKSFRK